MQFFEYSLRKNVMTEDIAPNEFALQSRQVVSQFVQSVVVLDDFAEFSDQTEPKEPIKVDVSLPNFTPPSADKEGSPETGFPFDAKSAIDRFAELGSVCAVLKPDRNEDFHPRIINVAAKADVVVLDWKIGNSYGGETLEIIQSILKEDSQNERMRLIAVYTGEPDLIDIAGQVATSINAFYSGSPLSKPDGFRMSKGPLHVVILAKPGLLNSSNSLVATQVVSESDLPDRLIDEFARMAAGLLRNVALAGVTALRDDAYRLLAKFDASLDPAYLGHRLMLPHPPDAEEHIVEALGSEVLSILEDRRPGDQASIGAVKQWLVAQQASGLDLEAPMRFPGAMSVVDRWGALLQRGMKGASVTLPVGGEKTLNAQATEAFTINEKDATYANRHFSSLLVFKSRYSETLPTLTLGTIVARGAGSRQQYFLCVQPKCDSVRLKGVTGFPLLPLVIQTNADKRFRLALKLAPNRWKYFDFLPRPANLVVPTFNPDPSPPNAVVATKNDKGFRFTDTRGRLYWWVAEMKDEHALKISADLAAELARPGPNHSEWLRRAARQ